LVDEIALFLPLAQIDAIQWRNDMPQDVILWADQDQIYRILMNLTKNAVEAVSAQGPGGTVRVTGGTADESIFIEVADTGPGLSQRARDHLFEAFSGSVGGTGTGLGLGLAIAYELTRNHGGRLELTKSDPTGTVFHAIFPNSPPPPQRRIRR
jgi:signal transduction histidine kinase